MEMRTPRATGSPAPIGLLVTAVIAALVGMTAGWWTSPAMATSQPYSCTSIAHRGVSGWENGGNSYDNNSKGTGSDIWAPANNADCISIRSIYVVRTDLQADVEVGLFSGYQTCDQTDHHLYIHPTVFRRSATSAGVVKCAIFSTYHPTEATYDTYSVSDVNTANSYQYFWNGTSLGTVTNSDFTQGYNDFATERPQTIDDPGKGHFHNLKEYHDGNGWTVWNTLALQHDSDGGFKLKLPPVDNHTGDVVPQ